MNMVHGLLRVEGEDGSDENTPLPHPNASYTAPAAVDAAEAERREAAERANEIKALTKLVIVGAVLTLPVFAVTMLHMANPALAPHWMVNPWLQAILITPVMFYCGRPIHTVGFPALAHRSPDMNSLVSLGTSAAYLYSLVTCIAPWVFPRARASRISNRGRGHHPVLVGRLLETKAREGTGKAVQSLIKLRPRTAHKLNATSADNVDGIEWRNPAHFTDTDIDAIATGRPAGRQERRARAHGRRDRGRRGAYRRIDDHRRIQAGLQNRRRPGDRGHRAAQGRLRDARHPSRRGHGTLADRGDGGPRPGDQGAGAAAGR